MSSKIQKILVIAIELGTDDSGYAFSFSGEYEENPTKVSIRQWNFGYTTSLKQPTCVLCDPRGQFHSFGYKAEDKYSELSEQKEHYNWYFFRKFINMLSEKQINMRFELTDENGLKMPARKVVSMAIRYFKDDSLTLLEPCYKNLRVDVDDVHWVLPVPTTWTVSAKDVLREAAKEAGIDGANLTIALEPDAAAVYCEALPSARLSCGGRFDDKYMVIDLGDSKAVFTVHEKQPDGTIKDVHKVSSGPWGSTKVNEEFTQMIINIFGDRAFTTFCDDNRLELVEMLREVEVKKRNIRTKDSMIFIRAPSALGETYQEITGKTVQDAIEQSPYKGKIQWKAVKMELDAELFRSFFKNCISNITNHIENLCQEPGVKGTSTFLMIGKFSECQLVQEAVIKAFPKGKVVIPDEPGLVVMKGAVVLGHKFGLTCGYTLRLKQPMNKDHSAVATTLAKRDEDDVSSDNCANGATCSSSYEQGARKDQIRNLKCQSLRDEREDALSSDVLELSIQTQDKSTQGLETQLKNQMTLIVAKRDEDDVSSDNYANGATCSSSYEQGARKDQIRNLKCQSLRDEGEDAVSSDVLEMSIQTQDKSTQGLEAQLKNQMTLEADNTRAPSDDELFDLSRQLNKLDKEWWLLAKLLGLSDEQINEIEQTKGDMHIVRQYYKMLTAWKRHNAGQEKGSVRYLLRKCDEAGIDRKVTDTVFGN